MLTLPSYILQFVPGQCKKTSCLIVSTPMESRLLTLLYWFSSHVGSHVNKTVLPAEFVVWRFRQSICIHFAPLLESWNSNVELKHSIVV